MPRGAYGLNVSEAEPALARKALEVDDAAQGDRVAAVLGVECERSARAVGESGLELVRSLENAP